MDAPASHPRRRPQKATSPRPPALSSSPRLRKVDTAHAKSSALSDMIDPVVDAAFIPKRSPTSSKALDALVHRPRPHIADLLDRTEKVLAGLTDARGLINDQVWAVPNLLLEHTAIDDEDFMDLDDKKPAVNHHRHDSDSGLGSSISTAPSSVGSSGAAINRSFTATSSFDDDDAAAADSGRPLSDFAAKEIKDHILDPLLARDAFEPFRSLVNDVPRRIGTKEIKNLRDLEKNLLLLAFDIAPSSKSYVDFCTQTITCILATVNNLPEDDRQLPADRPFTNSYALDLIDQIRRYAQIMAETRAREAEGKPLEEKDYSPDEELTVQGGFSYDGKPAQLVRKKANGDTIPIASPAEVEAVKRTSPMKRSFDGDESDSDAVRSMARRRKSDRPGDVEHKCRACDKRFKRPCDLTKHEKTHSRPWKCPEKSCRYHTEGWPTEKEMERHFNDRHTTAPKMYKCLYEGCTYTSKRESNCKQHMEKSHGYNYVRSKTTARSRNSHAGPLPSGSPPTPLTPFTPASNHVPTPNATSAPSPAFPSYADFGFSAMHGQPTPMMAPYDFPVTDHRRQSNATAASSAVTFSTSQSSYQSPLDRVVTPEETMFEQTMNINMNMTASNDDYLFQHPPTPASDPTPPFDFNAPLPNINTNVANSSPIHISPLGQGDMTLLSLSQSQIPVDEGLGDDMFQPTGSDFTLFDSPSSDLPGGSMFANMNDMDLFQNSYNYDGYGS